MQTLRKGGFIILSLFTAFFLGLLFAGLVGAGKDQGLAGGAIVLGYGVIGAVLGLVVSLFAMNKLPARTMTIINSVFLVFILGYVGWATVKFNEQKKKLKDNNEIAVPKKSTAPASDIKSMPISAQEYKEKDMMLGFYKPNFYEHSALYFYGNINLGKSVVDHTPTDSVAFKQAEYGGFEITSAPPWLWPRHMKMDYEILLFPLKTMGRDYCEIVVNDQTNQTAWVDRMAGEIILWPSFILSVAVLEWPDDYQGSVHIKPLDHASTVSAEYDFMRSVLVQGEWLKVELLNQDFKVVGEGWVKWRDSNKLLVAYSLLS